MKNEENKQWSPEARTLQDAKKFVRELREMPYDNSEVGQTFVIVTWKRLPGTDKSKGDKK